MSSWHQYISALAADSVLNVFPQYNDLESAVSQWETGHDYYIQYQDAVNEVREGWNQYYPSHANVSQIDYTITDMGAMFVPDNNAVKKYFLPGGNGAFLIDIYGTKENTEANLLENLDSLHVRNPQILTAFIRNLQKRS